MLRDGVGRVALRHRAHCGVHGSLSSVSTLKYRCIYVSDECIAIDHGCCVYLISSLPSHSLRDACEMLLSTQLRTLEDKAKDQINLLINFELAYMNTTHPDFIGFMGSVATCIM